MSSSDAKLLLALRALWHHEGSFAAFCLVGAKCDILPCSDGISNLAPCFGIRAPQLTLDIYYVAMSLMAGFVATPGCPICSGRAGNINALICDFVHVLTSGLKRQNLKMKVTANGALLRKAGEAWTSPFPRRTYPTGSVTGVPSAVKPFSTAARIWS